MFLNYTPMQVASQMTLIDHVMFKRIQEWYVKFEALFLLTFLQGASEVSMDERKYTRIRSKYIGLDPTNRQNLVLSGDPHFDTGSTTYKSLRE